MPGRSPRTTLLEVEVVEGAAAILRGESWTPSRETLYGAEPPDRGG